MNFLLRVISENSTLAVDSEIRAVLRNFLSTKNNMTENLSV